MELGSYIARSEIHDGLVSLLAHSVVDNVDDQPSSLVLTTAPSIWLSNAPLEAMTVVDLSVLTGSVVWQSKRDIQDNLLEQIHDAGWPDHLVIAEPSPQIFDPSAGLASLHDARRKREIRSYTDIALLSETGVPVAIVAIILPHQKYLADARYQARTAARQFNISHVLIYDGQTLSSSDGESGTLTKRAAFPSPQELGLTVSPAPNAASSYSDENTAIQRCATVETLIKAIHQNKDQPIIIDFTMPWSEKTASIVKAIGPSLSPAIQNAGRLDTLTAVLALVASLRTTRRLVIVVPRAIVTHARLQQFRTGLASLMTLIGVLELPTDTFAPFANIPTSILVLSALDTNREAATFLALASRGDLSTISNQPWLNEWICGLGGGSITIGFQTKVELNRPWTVAAYHPDVRQAEQNLQRLAQTVPLGQLCAIRIGQRFARDEITEKRRGKEHVIRGRDLSSPSLTKESLLRFGIDEAIDEYARVREGDILVQRIGDSPRSMLVGPELDGAIAGDTIIVLRLKEASVDPMLIVQLLQSMAGQNVLRAGITGAGAPTLSTKHLETFPVPVLPDVVATDLNMMQQIERDLRIRADRMASMRLSIFGAGSPRELSQQLDVIRRTARAVSSSIQQAESPDFQIRNFYPYPLAYSYRTLASFTSVQDRYKEQLRVAENILAYLASLTLALVTAEERATTSLGLVEKWRGGISPGHWRELIQRGGKIIGKYESNGLAVALSNVWKQPFIDQIETLISAKNDFKHDRGPKLEEDYEVEVLKLGRVLEDVMSALAFLIEYPVRLVTRMDGVRGSRMVTAQTLRYEGDHPGLPQERVRYREALTTHDLYVEIQPDQWISLFPFITVQNCPNCKTRETYFIDRWQQGKKAQLKSFERGHVEGSDEVGAEVEKWQG